MLSGCTSVVFRPSSQVFFEPSERLGIVPQNIYFSPPEGPKLHAWFFPAQGTRKAKGTVIQFHGNAENMTSHFLSVLWVIKHGYNLFTFDYRGYGESEGVPYPAGVNADALNAMVKASEYLSPKEGSLILYGQSLGGAIALRALNDFPEPDWIKAVVIESSFLSYKSIGKDKLSTLWFTWPLQWMSYLLMSDEYAPQMKIKKRPKIPLLIVHGTDDKVVPIRHGKDLFKKSIEPKCFWEIPTAIHVGMMNLENGKYRAPMLKFLNDQICPKN